MTMDPDLVPVAAQAVEQYQQNLRLLKSLSAMIASPKDSIQLRSEIAAQIGVLQDFDNRLKEIFKRNRDSTDIKLRKLDKDFRLVRVEAAELIQRLNKTISETKSDEEVILSKIRPMTSSNGYSESSQPATGQNGQMTLQYDTDVQTSHIEEQIMKERHEAMVKIHSDMNDVHEMFVDLAKIVHGQQDAVNAIEKHAEDGQERAHEGFGQIQNAKENQSLCVIS